MEPVSSTIRLHAEKILGISVTIDKKEVILEYVVKYLQLSNSPIVKSSNNPIKPFIIVTPNPEQIVLAQTDFHFAQLLNQADVALPDGSGVVWALRIRNYELRMKKLRRVSGVDFMEELVGMAAVNAVNIGLIGGSGNLAEKALECLQKIFPKLQGWGMDGPEIRITNYQLGIMDKTEHLSSRSPVEIYFQNLTQQIVKNHTQIVFVGFGAPKQEYFIEKLEHSLSLIVHRKISVSETIHDTRFTNTPLILMSVGGAFDLISGRTKRAPFIMRKLGVEWLWRLILEPWRWKRQLSLVKFVSLVLKNTSGLEI